MQKCTTDKQVNHILTLCSALKYTFVPFCALTIHPGQDDGHLMIWWVVPVKNRKLSYHRGSPQRAVSAEIWSAAAQLYKKLHL